MRGVLMVGIAVILFLVGLGFTNAGFATSSNPWLFEEGASYVRMGDITSVQLVKGDRVYDAFVPDLRYAPDPRDDSDMARFQTMPERAYTLDFRHSFSRITPNPENSFTLEEMNRLRGLESLSDDTMTHVRWILKHSMPYLQTPAECAALAGLPALSENDVVVATQLAIWSVVTGTNFRSADLSYPEQTGHMIDFYTALVLRTMGPEDRAEEPIQSDVSFAQVRVEPGPLVHRENRGVYGPFRLSTALSGTETCQVWLEDLDESERGAVLEDGPREQIAQTTTGDTTRTAALELSPGNLFYVNTMGAMCQSGDITLRVSNRIKISYESELLVWGAITESGRREYASLVTAGLFVSKPSASVRITWGSNSKLRLAAPTADGDLGVAGDKPTIEIMDDARSSLVPVPDSDAVPVEHSSITLEDVIEPSSDEETPSMLIVPGADAQPTFRQWLKRWWRSITS